MPGFTALLWLGHFPSWRVLIIALITAVAGYTAIYALNDLVGLRADREKFTTAPVNRGYSVEASALRYPLARGLLSLRSGILWCAFWCVVALIGCYLLNPLIIVILVAAGLLEAGYCLLLKVTYWRTLVSGLVKSAGPVAAVFAVVPRPSLPMLGLMLAWLMLWEMGGQNIPADWNDVAEDRRIGAKTIPLVLGPRVASIVVVVTLALAVALSLALPRMSPLSLGASYLIASGLAGIVLLLWPALQLAGSRSSERAARLFDRASLYPLAQLAIISVFVLM